MWYVHWVAQSCLALCNPMDCSLPGFCVHWILQAILEQVAIFFSRVSFWPRDQTRISCVSWTDRLVLYHSLHLGNRVCVCAYIHAFIYMLIYAFLKEAKSHLQSGVNQLKLSSVKSLHYEKLNDHSDRRAEWPKDVQVGVLGWIVHFLNACIKHCCLAL